MERDMSNRPQDLFNDWYARIDIYQKAHSISSQGLDAIYRAIGMSIIVLGAFTGVILLSGMNSLTIRVITGLMGLLAAVLAGIQTFHGYKRRAEMHRSAVNQLGLLKQEMEELEKLPPRYLDAQTEAVLQIGQRLEKIKQSAPLLEEEVIRQIRSNGEDSESLVKKFKTRD